MVKSCLNLCSWVSHNALFWKFQAHRQWTLIWFWLSISGNSSQKLHCGDVVNLPYFEGCCRRKDKDVAENWFKRLQFLLEGFICQHDMCLIVFEHMNMEIEATLGNSMVTSTDWNGHTLSIFAIVVELTVSVWNIDVYIQKTLVPLFDMK